MKYDRLFSTLSAGLLIFTTISCGKGTPLKDGIYTGIGQGRNGTIEVTISIENGNVYDAKILRDEDSHASANSAKQQIMKQFMTEGPYAKLDAISGASLTSNGLITALNMAVDASKGKSKKSDRFNDTKCDIAIIGAGGAGLVAATEAASKGANVIVLEKMGIVGGNTNFSTGGINASYTKEQARLGIKDSPEVFFDDTMKGGKYLNDPDLVQELVDNSAATVEWLQSPLIGADLSDVGIFGGATNKRIHRPKGGAAIGAHLVPLLQKSATANGADIRLNSKVIDILKENGRASGVRVLCDGMTYTIKAKAVIIATGGFAANLDMVEFYQASLKGFTTTNHKGATGDAFAMVKKFNADLVQMDEIQIHPTVITSTGAIITEAVRGNGAILVNKEGKRFINELETRDIVSTAILKSTGKSAYLVFDRTIRDSLKAIDDYENDGYVIEGTTVKDLADKLNIPSDSLENTIKRYNGFASAKQDSDFSRIPQSMERTLTKAPFYAIEIGPAVHHTMGGLKINTKAQVMSKDDTPVPALYAAGEVTGGVHGAERLGGNAVADFCVFGKIAADSALEFIKK